MTIRATHATPNETSQHGVTRRQFLRTATVLSVGLVGASLLSVTGCSTMAPGASSGPSATWSLGVDLTTIDPHASTSITEGTVKRHMFEGLVTRDDSLKIVPLLATSWSNIDPLTWEFKLRENVKFHDGSSFSAADVKMSFDRMVDKKLNLSTLRYLDMIDHVDVVDATTARIVTLWPDPTLIAMLTYPGAVMLPGETFNKLGVEQFMKSPVGTGPYKFVEWVKDDHITMDASPTYWGEKPKIAKLIHKPILEAETRIAALKTGAVDLIGNVQPHQEAQIQSDGKLYLERAPSNRSVFVALNAFRPPFDDVRVRQALNYGIDVGAIIKNVFNGHATQTATIVSSVYTGFDPNQTPYPYDPDKAKALLAEAGYPNGFEATLSGPKGRYLLDVETIQALSGQLSKIGVTAKVEILEWGNLSGRAFDKDPAKRFSMLFYGSGNPVLDIDSPLSGWLDSKRRGVYYNDPKLDEMVLKSRSTLDPDARNAICRELLAHVKEQAPWMFLFSLEDVYGLNKRLTGWKARSDESVFLGTAAAS